MEACVGGRDMSTQPPFAAEIHEERRRYCPSLFTWVRSVPVAPMAWVYQQSRTSIHYLIF
jgi:hypothetical protein